MSSTHPVGIPELRLFCATNFEISILSTSILIGILRLNTVYINYERWSDDEDRKWAIKVDDRLVQFGFA